MTRPTALIDMLTDVWASLDSLLATLTESQWKTMTECPGWTVQDTLSHLVSSEKGLHGEPPTTHRASNLTHVKNPIGEFNEHEIDARRAQSGAAVFAEWNDISAKRRETLTTAGDDYFAREMMTPTGPGTFADFLHIRVMDAWVHEQDIRRALQLPGNDSCAAAEHSIGRFVRSLPMVVGKRGKAPDGSTVTVHITGPVAKTFHVATNGGKAAHVDSATNPACTISLDSNTYVALCCGRQFWHPGDKRVAIDGDRELAARILGGFNVMI
ncbi:MAG: maleylpyruvate isomerase family mycothiol-dependent enzyme [Actinomycetota bacterium]